jgi:hypothetical protein
LKETEESKLKAEIDDIDNRIKTILKNIEEIAPTKEEESSPAKENDTEKKEE